MSTSKGGRRSRGERKQVPLRIPLALYDLCEAKSEELDIPIGSYITMVLAERAGLPVPDYIQEELRKAEYLRQLEELPLAG